MELKDWTIEYIKARNAMTGTLKKHSVAGEEIICEYTTGMHHFIISPKLRVPLTEGKTTIVCENTQANIDYLVEHWDEFLQDDLLVLFANPLMHQSWQLNPMTHALVADRKTLKEGILTLASEVEFL